MFDLIIFDCDGVLVDSERIANEAFAKLLYREFGLSFSLRDMFDIFVGNSASQCVDIIEDLTQNKMPETFVNQYQTEINKALAESVQAVNGIDTILAQLEIPFCVASSGSHEKMALTLGKTNLLDHFKGKINSTSDVAQGKPHPDIYLHAAKRMGINCSERCLVIEDSPLGVQGGVAAGMTVFGFSELVDKEKLIAAGAHHTFDNMPSLIQEIENFSSQLNQLRYND